MGKIKIALAGVGNCASSLVQALQHYGNPSKAAESAGLAHPMLGNYAVSDIEIVAAFDVDKRKVGKDLSQAVFAQPNNAPKFTDVPTTKIIVQRGSTHDGITPEVRELVLESDEEPVDVVNVLKESGTRIVVGLLPSGAIESCYFYAEAALKAGCGYVNTSPVHLASDQEWTNRFQDAKLTLVGDDLMSQLGATALHRALLDFLVKRGVRIVESYQLDVGGGTESLESLHRARDQKRDMKTKIVSTEVPYAVPVTAGSTDYVYFLGNRRESYFYLQGRYIGDADFKIDLRLVSQDAPNSTSILLDVIRAMQIGIDRGFVGPLDPVCSYGFKAPPRPYPLAISETIFEHFIRSTRPV
ncbi:MAG: inositol-3-phosphate synthase [Candidatus Thorarchaeota archaeon]